MTIQKAFNDIAVAQGGTAATEKTITAAIDALNDALAGSDQPQAQTIEQAVRLLGEHIGSSSSGGGNTNWFGANPQLIKESSDKISFADMGFDDWTYSTTSTTITQAVTSATIRANVINYDYVRLFELHVHYEYSSDWEIKNAPLDYVFYGTTESYAYANTAQSYLDQTFTNFGTGRSSEFQLLYKDANGVETLAKQLYGFGFNALTNPAHTGDDLTDIELVYSTSISGRGHPSYFSSNAFNNIDFQKSYYEYSDRLYRVDAGSSRARAIVDNAQKLLLESE